MRINNVTFGGNLTRDPETRFLANEKAVCKFTLAYNEKFKGKDGEPKEEVTFLECEAWGRTAEIAGQYLTKGAACVVIGKLRQENWTDKDSGAKRSKLTLRVGELVLGARREGGERADGEPTAEAKAERPAARPAAPRPAPAAGGDDEPPF